MIPISRQLETGSSSSGIALRGRHRCAILPLRNLCSFLLHCHLFFARRLGRFFCFASTFLTFVSFNEEASRHLSRLLKRGTAGSWN